MKRLVMTKLGQAQGLSDTVGVLVDMETSEGPLELRLTYDDAQRLTAALHRTLEKIPQKANPVERWETGIDPVNQDAVLLARYADQTTQEMRIPRTEVRQIARFLDQAAERFDSSADMRQ